MSRLFGTDGVRGKANMELTPELAFKLGEAAAYILKQGHNGDVKRILIGKDTRLSGDMLEAALAAGICSQGVDACLVGICPTPAIAYLTKNSDALAGAVISASHNPFEDNGIKFFSHAGHKLFDSIEDEIEMAIRGDIPVANRSSVVIGAIRDASVMKKEYISSILIAAGEQKPFTGLKIVVDCSNGAASDFAPYIWEKLGAQTHVIHNRYNGVNINKDCGSTHPAEMRKAVVAKGANFGIAYDGDADRVIMADEKGNEIDGDRIMYLLAVMLKQKGELAGDKVVVTVMSNMGLELALRQQGISIETTGVGDRYVLERMLEKDLVLGGEQSGHIIMHRLSSTGDGIMTSVQAALALIRSGKPLSEVVAAVQSVPQKLVNIKVKDKRLLADCVPIWKQVAIEEENLAGVGRILVRTSGTEHLVRVMVEATDDVKMDESLKRLVAIVEQELGI